jgi:hypothetical protein
MTAGDAAQYLPHMGLDPMRVVTCPAPTCPNTFALVDGFAIEAIVGERVSIVFFCSPACYLNEVPVDCCARA